MNESEILQKLAQLESDISDLDTYLKAWRGWTKRRVNELTSALNENTMKDVALKDVVQRINQQELKVSQQELKAKKHDRSNLFIYIILAAVGFLAVTGEIEAGQLTEILIALIGSAVALGAAVAKSNKE